MFKAIQHIDENLLKVINVDCSNSLFDFLMPFFRNPYFWAPVYLFLLVWMWSQFGMKGIWWCVFFFITFTFTDFISASLLKPIFHRVRPCNDFSVSVFLTHVVKCGVGYSLPSSHAANHFGLSFFMIYTIGKINKTITPLAIAWALLVCYSQMYVGVHYPTDILFGAFIGFGIGKFNASYFNKRFGLL